MLILIRRLRRTTLRSLLQLVFFLLALDAYLIVRNRPVTDYPDHIPPRHPGNETFFIASIHRNNGPILGQPMSENILKLVDYLGLDRVHFSAVESGSQDDTKDKLSALKEKLDAKGVQNTISLGKTVHEQLDEIHDRPPASGLTPPPPGWIWNAKEGHFDMRRITYLARERNRAMEPLKALGEKGVKFDKVIWLNDVVFETLEVAMLLGTRGGDFAAACGMDFTLWPYYYDTFALRDDLGLKTASWYWPWFHSARARASAEAMRPVQVKSCWNGIVAFDAAPFYAETPLRFRAIDDSLAALHLEGSECCLIHADNYLSREKGVWLNPNVRVGYNEEVFRQTRLDRFPTPWTAVVGIWANRYLRARNSIQLGLEAWVVEKRLRRWVDETPTSELPRKEPGKMCLINEMQIMWMNGWKHI
ncbi:polysaccharide export protein [Colletotrichum truncatum]|uniref:Polysaccharide export protein n=1 Tax=Colletotrichum truncatum TaxID=5467 RepID=A0ACC3YX09_COLTU|nr:polysaccharide export protein [Colletotrichum truncatum]KAF6792586.1 polysaccharide export protein [Colletotrichum truncatum]